MPSLFTKLATPPDDIALVVKTLQGMRNAEELARNKPATVVLGQVVALLTHMRAGLAPAARKVAKRMKGEGVRGEAGEHSFEAVIGKVGGKPVISRIMVWKGAAKPDNLVADFSGGLMLKGEVDPLAALLAEFAKKYPQLSAPMKKQGEEEDEEPGEAEESAEGETPSDGDTVHAVIFALAEMLATAGDPLASQVLAAYDAGDGQEEPEEEELEGQEDEAAEGELEEEPMAASARAPMRKALVSGGYAAAKYLVDATGAIQKAQMQISGEDMPPEINQELETARTAIQSARTAILAQVDARKGARPTMRKGEDKMPSRNILRGTIRETVAKAARAPMRKAGAPVITEGQPGKRNGKSDYRLVQRLSDDEVVLDEGNGPELFVGRPEDDVAGFAVVIDGVPYEFVRQYTKAARAPMRKATGRRLNESEIGVVRRVLRDNGLGMERVKPRSTPQGSAIDVRGVPDDPKAAANAVIEALGGDAAATFYPPGLGNEGGSTLLVAILTPEGDDADMMLAARATMRKAGAPAVAWDDDRGYARIDTGEKSKRGGDIWFPIYAFNAYESDDKMGAGPKRPYVGYVHRATELPSDIESSRNHADEPDAPELKYYATLDDAKRGAEKDLAVYWPKLMAFYAKRRKGAESSDRDTGRADMMLAARATARKSAGQRRPVRKANNAVRIKSGTLEVKEFSSGYALMGVSADTGEEVEIAWLGDGVDMFSTEDGEAINAGTPEFDEAAKKWLASDSEIEDAYGFELVEEKAARPVTRKSAGQRPPVKKAAPAKLRKQTDEEDEANEDLSDFEGFNDDGYRREDDDTIVIDPDADLDDVAYALVMEGWEDERADESSDMGWAYSLVLGKFRVAGGGDEYAGFIYAENKNSGNKDVDWFETEGEARKAWKDVGEDIDSQDADIVYERSNGVYDKMRAYFEENPDSTPEDAAGDLEDEIGDELGTGTPKGITDAILVVAKEVYEEMKGGEGEGEEVDAAARIGNLRKLAAIEPSPAIRAAYEAEIARLEDGIEVQKGGGPDVRVRKFEGFSVGDQVMHKSYGQGRVMALETGQAGRQVSVVFSDPEKGNLLGPLNIDPRKIKLGK